MNSPLYSPQEVIERMINRFQLFNSRNPDAVNNGLTDQEVCIIGEIDAALKGDIIPERIFTQRGYDVSELGIGA